MILLLFILLLNPVIGFQPEGKPLTSEIVEVRHVSSGVKVNRQLLWDNLSLLTDQLECKTVTEEEYGLYGTSTRISFNESYFIIPHEKDKYPPQLFLYDSDLEFIIEGDICIRVGNELDERIYKYRHRSGLQSNGLKTIVIHYHFKNTKGDYQMSENYLSININPQTNKVLHISDSYPT